MKIRLLRKLADCLDGIDVSGFQEGDVMVLPNQEAELLIAERWATPLDRRDRSERRSVSARPERAVAAERRPARSRISRKKR